MSGKLSLNAAKLYFWSDLHLFHKSAAQHRGFGDDVEAMNEHLFSQCRKLPADAVLVLLGDISFAGTAKTIDALRELKVRKILVRGNHDKGMTNSVLAEFDSAHDLLTVKAMGSAMEDGGQELMARIVCCHFPLLAWDMAHHGAWHLHGHSHGSARYPKPCRAIDVGVDAFGAGGPVSLTRLKEEMDKRELVVFDHHRVRAEPGWSDTGVV